MTTVRGHSLSFTKQIPLLHHGEEMELHRSHLRLLSIVLIAGASLNLVLNDVTIRVEELSTTNGSNSQRPKQWQIPHGSFQQQPVVNTSKSSPKLSSRQSIELFVNNTTLSTQQHTNHTKDKWEDSKVIPQWMKDYFAWHKQVRQGLNENNWEEYHYLLQRCVQSDKKCSGAADRLKAIPSVILMASQARPRRLLFIAWTRPAPLEEFLVPPATGGLDWRLPAWLAPKLDLERRGPKFWLDQDTVAQWPTIPDPIVRIKNLRGTEYYNQFRQEEEATFDQVYRDVWSVVFEPTPIVTALTRQAQGELSLRPGQYVAAHARTLYVSDTGSHHEEVGALQCALQQAGESRQQQPIYFASDSRNTTLRALEYGRKNHVSVVARTDQEPIHLDRGRSFLANSNDWKSRPASDFYGVFVDLFLLADSRCVIYGAGGFGHWASLLSRNHSCSVNHRNRQCNETDNTA